MARVNRTVLSKEVPTVQYFGVDGIVRTLNDFFVHTTGVYQWTGELPHAVVKDESPFTNSNWVLVANTSKPVIFSTVQELKDSNTVQEGDTVLTMGYNDSTDLGGGLYSIIQGSNADGTIDHNLQNSLKAVALNPTLKSCGAKKGTDVTNLINELLKRTKYVLVDTEYLVNVEVNSSGINTVDDCVLEFKGNGKLTLVPTSREKYQVINCVASTNVKIINPVLQGDRLTHTGTGGEWGHGVYITMSKNVRIIDPVITDMWGDGLCITSPSEPDLIENPNATKGIHIINGTFSKCRRQGFSITGGRDIHFYGKQVCTDIKGAPPEGAFDIEVNNFVPLIGLSIQNVVGINCNGYTFNLYSNNGTRIMKNVSIGDLVSVNGRRGSLNIAITPESLKGYLNNLSIKSLHQSITDDYTGDTNACNGVYLDKITDLRLGGISTEYRKSGAYTLRVVNGADVSIDSLVCNGGKSIQCSSSTLNLGSCTVLNSTGGDSSEQLYVSGGGSCSIGNLSIPYGGFNILCAGPGSNLSINSGSLCSANSSRDVYARVMAGSTLSMNNCTYNVKFSANTVLNEGTFIAHKVDFGFNRTGSTGVQAESGSSTYLSHCDMLGTGGNPNNALGLFKDGSTGYCVSCSTVAASDIRILSGSSVKNVGHVHL